MSTLSESVHENGVGSLLITCLLMGTAWATDGPSPKRSDQRLTTQLRNEAVRANAGNQALVTPALAADVTVSGIVTDETGDGMPGVSVVVKGTQRGTTTNADGRFTLNVPNTTSVLVFSFVGYPPQEVTVGNQTQLNVSLKADTKSLSEVIVVGYGTQKKANLTGAVDMITSDVFDNRPMTNLNQGLQGVLPNLNIKLGDGKPNQAPSFNIRGTTSIGQGGNALVLIDNVEGDPSLLNPNDVASITLLKDAASASIYGARGVFGVVLITTKTQR